MADNGTFYWPSVASSGVTTVNGISGAVVLVAGTGISVTPAGQNITIASTSSGDVTIGAFGSTPNANGLSISGSQVLNLQPADATHPGGLSSTDWNTFNNKQAALTLTNLTDVGTDGITIGNGTGAVIGASPVTISQHVADSTHNGYLSSTDWSTFNSKGSGSVTSVAMTVPAFLSIAGSPVTGTGTLAVSLSGTALPVANGGTGQVTAAAAFNALSPITTTGDMIYSPSGATSQRLAIGSTGNVLTVAGGVPAWAPPATAGTVTSVAMTVPSFLSIGGSPITSSGTLAVSLSGTALPVANGGTGRTSSVYYNGYYPGSASNYWTLTSSTYADFTVVGSIPTISIAQGAGLTVTNAASSLPGIAFTPAVTGVIEITALISLTPGTIGTAVVWDTQLYEGNTATVIDQFGVNTANNLVSNAEQIIVSGFFAVTASTAYSFRIRAKTSASTLYIGAATNDSCLAFKVRYVA